MTGFLTIGIVLGLSAGFAPGPLLALVVSETLRHDIKAGVKVALSPLITDLPIVVLTLAVLSQLSGFNNILGIISLIGGAVILYMGFETMNPKQDISGEPGKEPGSLARGILVNAMSPHPYLFWFSVGGPIMSRALQKDVTTVAVFICGFYVFLVGSKILLAILVGRSKSFLSGPAYLFIMRLLGLALCVLALLLFRDGLDLLGIMPS